MKHYWGLIDFRVFYEIIFEVILGFHLPSLGFYSFIWSALIRVVLNLYSGYTGATATLIFGGRAEIDPLKENCPDPKVYLVQTIDKLNRENPGQVKFFLIVKINFMIHIK